MAILDKDTIVQRSRQCYTPYDSLYGLCDDKTVLFLPPSRMNLGILSTTFPQPYPLEFMPCEYFCCSFEDGSVYYCRPSDGFKDFCHWVFDEKGRAVLTINQEGIRCQFTIEVRNETVIAVSAEIINNTARLIQSMYINPCFRYQNQPDFKGKNHENIYIVTEAGPQSIFDISGIDEKGLRILVLHKHMHQTPLNRYRITLLDTLMKSRFMGLSQFAGAHGETITCMNREHSQGVLFGYDNPFGFFSRSHNDESGCMHVLPLLENFKAGEVRRLTGTILWGEGSVVELQKKYLDHKIELKNRIF